MEQQSKNIIRVEKNQDYTVINNTSLYDERLSWKAKAIHVYMLSKPDDWVFYNEELVKWAKDGPDSFASGLKELTKLGYVKKERRRGTNGKFEWVTVVYEVPQELAVPVPEKPSMENPPMEVPNEEGQAKTQPYPEKPYMENPPMENPSVEKPSMEKPFVENPEILNTNALSTESLSTDIPNTDSLNTNTTNQPNNPREQNRTSQEIGWGRVVAFYHNNIHQTPAPIVYEKLGMMYDLHPIADLALEALQIAVLNHAKNHIHYAESILIRWRNQNITTLEQARFEQQREGQQHASNQQTNAGRPVPSHNAKIADEGIRSKLRNFSSR